MLPRLARPCPALDRLDAVVEDGFCTLCRREVQDLTGMDAAARDAFVAASGGETCISFTGFVRPALAAAAIAASAAVIATPGPALARAEKAVHRQAHVPAAATDPAIHTVPVLPVPVMTAGVPAMPPRGTPSRTMSDGRPGAGDAETQTRR